MQQSGETGGKLAEMIKKAIKDGKLTNAEYDQIMMLADADQAPAEDLEPRPEAEIVTVPQAMAEAKPLAAAADRAVAGQAPPS